MRLNYAAIAPEGTKALAGVNAALLRAGLNKRLMDLLFLRVSQETAEPARHRPHNALRHDHVAVKSHDGCLEAPVG